MEQEYDSQAVADLLSDLAHRHGYSLRRLGYLAGVHDRTVTNYANGERDGRSLTRPEPELLFRVAVVFGPDDGAKLMEVCGLPLFAEALRRFDVTDDGEVTGLEFLPHFQRPRIARIVRDVLERAKGVYVSSFSHAA